MFETLKIVTQKAKHTKIKCEKGKDPKSCIKSELSSSDVVNCNPTFKKTQTGPLLSGDK